MAQAPRNGAIPDYVEVLAGQDGSATRALKTDANGRVIVASDATLSAGPTGTIPVGGSTGSDIRALWITNPGFGFNQALVVAGMKDTTTSPALPDSALEAADADDGNDILATAPTLLVGTTHARQRGVSTSKPGQATALANGATADGWTPAAGKKFRVLALVVGASVAGRYALVEGAGNALVLPLRLPANQSVPLVIPANGILSAAANNVLKVRNDSGGAADVDWCAWGLEE